MARVLHMISSDERRGAEVFAWELAEHLRAAGHEVRVMAVAPSGSSKVLDAEIAGSSRTDPRGFLRALKAARWADCVVSFGSSSLIPGSLIAKLARRPFVYRNIGDPAVWGAARFAGLRVGAPVRSAAAVVALYPGARDTLVERYRLDASRVRIIPRGVPAERFSPVGDEEAAAARERLGLDPKRSWLAYVGALSPEKDPLLALDILDRLPDDVGLVMAGTGPIESEVREAAARFGERVVMLGSVTDVRDVLSAAAIMVLTSRTEGIPGAVIEAGLSGIATVATAVGGVPNVIVDSESGRLVPLDEPDAFAEAVLDALEHRAEYGAAALARCTEEYSMANVGARWEGVHRDLLDPSPAPGGRVLQVVASTQRRGAEVFAEQLGRALDHAGWSYETVSVTRAAGGAELDFPVVGRNRFGPTTLLRLTRLARHHDVLIAHGSNSLLPTMVAARLARRPFAYRNIGDPQHWGAVRLANWRIGWPLRRANTVTALSAPAKAWIASQYSVDEHRIVVIPNAVDTTSFETVESDRRAGARERFGLDEDAEVFGYLGALSAEKRPDWAVRSLAGRPSARLLIAGSGPLRAEIEALAERLAPGRVRFLGVIDDSHDFYAAIDRLLVPSLTEGMPAVAIEAALSGVPTIATDVGAVREILIDHDAGTTVDPASLPLFVEAVAAADLTERVSRATSAAIAAEFGMERIALMWISELELLRHRVPPAPR